jgi:hypothetical protein
LLPEVFDLVSILHCMQSDLKSSSEPSEAFG